MQMIICFLIKEEICISVNLYQKTAFEKNVSPYLDTYPRVIFTEKELKRCQTFAFVKAAMKKNSGEKCHQVDGGQEYKRNYTGILGELAIEKFLGIQFIDWTVGPNSAKYNLPDVGVKNVGVKTVECGKMPIVQSHSYYPEIICIKNEDDSVSIAGLATVEVLNQSENLDENLILSPNLRNRKVKSGFKGFKNLIPIDTLRSA